MRRDRKMIRDTFIRICRDSRFSVEAQWAAAFSAQMLGIHPIEVWTAFGSIDTMKAIATGKHPVVQN